MINKKSPEYARLTENARELAEYIADESEGVLWNILHGSYDDPSRNGEMAQKALDIITEIPQRAAGGLWIDGSEGGGRHNTAYIAVQHLFDEVFENYMYKVFFLFGNELEDASYTETELFLRELTVNRLKENSVCLVIDASDGFGNYDTLLRVLSRIMLGLKPNEEENLLTVILIGGEGVKLPSAARDMFMRLVLTKPSLTARARFAEERWKMLLTLLHSLDDYPVYYDPIVEFAETARLTEEFTFCELKDVVENLYLRELVTDNSRDLDRYSMTEYPQEASERYIYQTDMMRRVMEAQGLVTEPQDTFERELAEHRLEAMHDRHMVAEALTGLLDELPELLTDVLPQMLSQRTEAITAAAKEKVKPSVKVSNTAEESEPEFTEDFFAEPEDTRNDKQKQPSRGDCKKQSDSMSGAEIGEFCHSDIFDRAAALLAEIGDQDIEE